MAVNETFTIPSTRQVAIGAKSTWAIDFVAELEEGEVIASGAATLVRVVPPWIDAITGFVVGTPAVVGTSVQVAFDAANLVRGEAYELKTKATLTSGKVLPLVTRVEVTG